MLHASFAMISSAALSHFDWTALVMGLKTFAVHVMDHQAIWV